MKAEIKEWEYALCKGWIVAYVAQGRDKPERIAKSVRTIMGRGRIDQNNVEWMLEEINWRACYHFWIHLGIT